MEVIPWPLIHTATGLRILHVCGGDPYQDDYGDESVEYSPRMWRWSCDQDDIDTAYDVFSTYVEVILSPSKIKRLADGILHVCGGDPNLFNFRLYLFWYSPRMWRWSFYPLWHMMQPTVFSTYVEVIPIILMINRNQISILHVCGGDPASIPANSTKAKYSPRMWRWSLMMAKLKNQSLVFSTYVEVILREYQKKHPKKRYSPRMWSNQKQD